MKRAVVVASVVLAMGGAIGAGAETIAGATWSVIQKRPVAMQPGAFTREYMAAAPDKAQKMRNLAGLLGMTIAGLLAVGGMALLDNGALAGFGGGSGADLHGNARFATKAEAQKAGLIDGDGVIIGKLRGRWLRAPAELFVSMLAPTGAGKGVSVVVPTLLTWQGSAIVQDIKDELYQITSGYRQKHGQSVHKLAMFDPDSPDGYNPLHYVRPGLHAVGDISRVAKILFPDPPESSSKSAAFFSSHSQNLFLAVTLYLMETGQNVSIGAVHNVAARGAVAGGDLRKWVKEEIVRLHMEGTPLSDVTTVAFGMFTGLESPETAGNIVASMQGVLSVFTDPIVHMNTSRNTFDLREMRRQHTTVYVSIPPADIDRAALLMALLFDQAMTLNMDCQLGENGTSIPCILVMDEMTAMGRIVALQERIAYMRSYGLPLLTITQSRSKIAATYGKEAENMLLNHAVRIEFAPENYEEAERISKELGNRTAAVWNLSVNGKTTTRSRSFQSRRLMLPEEVRAMGDRYAVVLSRLCPPIKADRIRYYAEPALMGRILSVAPDFPRKHTFREFKHACAEGMFSAVHPIRVEGMKNG